MKRYTAVVVGLGERGKIHLHGFLQNPDTFEVVGICNHSPLRLEQAAVEYGIPTENLHSDAETMLRHCKPDIMAFATLPEMRIPLVELAAKYGVKGLLFEKPMATSLADANRIVQLCHNYQMKAVVCHQHKYLRSFLRLREVIDSGDLGEIYEIHASCQAQASQLGTHYIDYMLWANGGAKAQAVVGHVHGNFYLTDSHPSPDYVFGQIAFENGVRGIVECGYFARQKVQHNVGFTHGAAVADYWTDDRLTVYGTKGYAWAECNGRYAVCTAPELLKGDYHDFFDREQFDAQVLYMADFVRWLDDDRAVHSCNVDTAYQGFEILEAIYGSALEHTRIDLPVQLSGGSDPLKQMGRILSPVIYQKYIHEVDEHA